MSKPITRRRVLFDPIRTAVLGFAIMMLMAGVVVAGTHGHHDVRGSRDSPLVSRYVGSWIIGYRHLRYAALQLPLSKSKHAALDKTQREEGQLTRILYVNPPPAVGAGGIPQLSAGAGECGLQNAVSMRRQGGLRYAVSSGDLSHIESVHPLATGAVRPFGGHRSVFSQRPADRRHRPVRMGIAVRRHGQK